MIQIHSQTMEAGEPAYLVSIDGEAPEPMSKKTLLDAGGLSQYLKFITKESNYARPDLVGDRGYHTCAQCGGSTRIVLDGEAWCDQCERYQ